MSESPERLILEQRARALARTFEDDVDDEKILSLMTFSLGNERYGVEIDFVPIIKPSIEFRFNIDLTNSLKLEGKTAKNNSFDISLFLPIN